MFITELRQTNRELYNTDKFDTDANVSAHFYGDFYNELLRHKQDANINLLEVGVQRGPSVRLFHDYLEKGNIYGIDISNQWDGPNTGYDRLKLFFFDAYAKEVFNTLPISKFDIIIDDGPHTLDSQIFAINNFINYLTDDGILVIEDVPIWNINSILEHASCDKSKIKTYNYYEINKRTDDVIITVKK